MVGWNPMNNASVHILVLWIIIHDSLDVPLSLVSVPFS